MKASPLVRIATSFGALGGGDAKRLRDRSRAQCGVLDGRRSSHCGLHSELLPITIHPLQGDLPLDLRWPSAIIACRWPNSQPANRLCAGLCGGPPGSSERRPCGGAFARPGAGLRSSCANRRARLLVALTRRPAAAARAAARPARSRRRDRRRRLHGAVERLLPQARATVVADRRARARGRRLRRVGPQRRLGLRLLLGTRARVRAACRPGRLRGAAAGDVRDRRGDRTGPRRARDRRRADQGRQPRGRAQRGPADAPARSTSATAAHAASARRTCAS